jgi:predicted peroxiredoxin
MKKTLLAIAAVLGLTGAAHADDTPTLVTIVASGEPQTQLMSMVLTMQSLKQGAETYILLCGPAGDLALKDAPASATAPQKPRGMSPQGLMQQIMASGATVEVCAIYLPNKGVGEDALLDGITAAAPPEMAARLLAPNTRIMSF